MNLKRVLNGTCYLEERCLSSIVSVLITVEFKGEVCCGGSSPVRLC